MIGQEKLILRTYVTPRKMGARISQEEPIRLPGAQDLSLDSTVIAITPWNKVFSERKENNNNHDLPPHGNTKYCWPQDSHSILLNRTPKNKQIIADQKTKVTILTGDSDHVDP